MSTHAKNYGVDEPVLPEGTKAEKLSELIKINAPSLFGQYPPESIEKYVSLAEIERIYILETLAIFKNNKEQTRKALGIGRATLYNKLRKYGKIR
jgi:DNA-binding NtrC family response regulator